MDNKNLVTGQVFFFFFFGYYSTERGVQSHHYSMINSGSDTRYQMPVKM